MRSQEYLPILYLFTHFFGISQPLEVSFYHLDFSYDLYRRILLMSEDDDEKKNFWVGVLGKGEVVDGKGRGGEGEELLKILQY